MNKPNKALIALIFIVFFGVGAIGFKIADKVFYPIAKAQTVSYLCEKYNAKPNEFKMKDYNQAHITKIIMYVIVNLKQLGCSELNTIQMPQLLFIHIAANHILLLAVKVGLLQWKKE